MWNEYVDRYQDSRAGQCDGWMECMNAWTSYDEEGWGKTNKEAISSPGKKREKKRGITVVIIQRRGALCKGRKKKDLVYCYYH